eukprot:SAG31_NODE_210_length_20286_cov_22.684748_11_plen_89_part_00
MATVMIDEQVLRCPVPRRGPTLERGQTRLRVPGVRRADCFGERGRVVDNCARARDLGGGAGQAPAAAWGGGAVAGPGGDAMPMGVGSG